MALLLSGRAGLPTTVVTGGTLRHHRAHADHGSAADDQRAAGRPCLRTAPVPM